MNNLIFIYEKKTRITRIQTATGMS